MKSNTTIHVAGNYIAEQHIETQILHAEHVYTHAPQPYRPSLPYEEAEEVMPSAEDSPGESTRSRPPGRRRNTHFLETPTFVYRYAEAGPDASRRLPLLYRLMTKEHHATKSFIDPGTPPDDFFRLFDGTLSDVVVPWTGSKQDLYYFIKRLKERRIIDIPQGMTVWTITRNHFSDRRGNCFEDLRNQHAPTVSAPVIERLVDILDPSAASTAELDGLYQKLGGSFGGR